MNWWFGVNVDYRFDASFPPSSPWRGPFDEAVNAWNAAPVKPNLNYSSGSWNGIYLYNYPDNNYGITFVTCTQPQGGTIDFFSIHYNNWYTDINYYGRRHVTGHELGHGLALGHSYEWAIMLTGYPVNLSPTVPQFDDINGLNSMYP